MKDRIEFVATLRRVSGVGFPMIHIDVDPRCPRDRARGYGAKSVPINAPLRSWIAHMMEEWLEETSGSAV